MGTRIVVAGLGLLMSAGLAQVAETARVDAMAPPFQLTDGLRKMHSLSDYRGKFVVLEWVN